MFDDFDLEEEKTLKEDLPNTQDKAENDELINKLTKYYKELPKYTYDFEQIKALSYTINILEKKIKRSNLFIVIKQLNNCLPQDLLLPLKEYLKKYDYKGYKVQTLFIEQLKKIVEENKKIPLSNLEKMLILIKKTLSLSDDEIEIIGYLFRSNEGYLKQMKNILRYHDYFDFDTKQMVSDVLNFSERKTVQLTNKNSKLITYSLIDEKTFADNTIILKTWLYDILILDLHTKQELIDHILGKPLVKTLNLSDFIEIENISFIKKLLKECKNKKGINILFYGEPGSGKTEFAKTIAKICGYKIYACAEDSPDRNSLQRYRFSVLNLSQKLLSNIKNSLLLFDEAEDIFSPNLFDRHLGKIEINRLLENNPRPTLWTTNNIESMDEAFIRRFTYAIHFKKPSIRARKEMWKRKLNKAKMSISEEKLGEFAQTYDVTPSFIESAIKCAKITHSGAEVISQHLETMQEAMSGGHKMRCEIEPKESFNIDLLNTDVNLSILTKQIKELKRKDFSLCLYGVSGTGKSAFARFLANKLGIKVLQKRASDLISPYVGETEQNIASAFEEAIQNESMLIFDEADSFLQDRSYAKRSWEIQQVNEMLTWMEKHPYPFICTTNIVNSLDKASLRRFTFKVKYDYLNKEQVKIAFKYFFKLIVNDKDIVNLTKLTPADFSLISKKNEILGQKNDFQNIIKLLEEEQALKDTLTGKEIGFRA